jgi:hypothetical protein
VRAGSWWISVRRDWEPEDLVGAWTLLDDDWALLANKSGANRLGFALMLKFFAIEARFPRHAGEFPKAAVAYVAGLVKVDAAELARYQWSGRTIKYHRKQIREALGFHPPARSIPAVLIPRQSLRPHRDRYAPAHRPGPRGLSGSPPGTRIAVSPIRP